MTAADLLLNLAAIFDNTPIQSEHIISITFDNHKGTTEILLTESGGPIIAAAICDLGKQSTREGSNSTNTYKRHNAPLKNAPAVTATWFSHYFIAPTTT